MRIVGNNPQLSRQTQGTASGAITSGKPVLVNTDGTVSEISATATAVAASVGSSLTVRSSVQAASQDIIYDTGRDKFITALARGDSNASHMNVLTVSGTSVSKGSDVAYNNHKSNSSRMAFDTNSNIGIVAYMDRGNSFYGTAIAFSGTGTAIGSISSEVVFESATTRPYGVVYDSNADRVIVFYRDDGNSNAGTAIVGTLSSGPSVSFGTATSIGSAIDELSHSATLTFDSNSNKVVFVYRDTGNSNYGTAIVGTVDSSDNSISFGSETVFNAASTLSMRATFDSNSNKVVIVYQDAGNSNYGTAIVGTVSGTSISFGSEVVFNAAEVENGLGIDFDTTRNKVIIGYRNNGNSGKGTAIEGTVSGTSISFATPIVFEENISTDINVVFDPDTLKSVLFYNENSVGMSASVYSPPSTTTNLSASTSEAFIGFAQDTVATGQPVTINTKGAIDENQSSLTPAQQYFVQTDGTLGTSADDPSVVAGTAVTATKLIVKG